MHRIGGRGPRPEADPWLASVGGGSFSTFIQSRRGWGGGVAGGRVDRLGYLDQEEDIRDVLEARARLDQVEGDGWYLTNAEGSSTCSPTSRVQRTGWSTRPERGYSGVVSAELLASANRLLAARGGELVVRDASGPQCSNGFHNRASPGEAPTVSGGQLRRCASPWSAAGGRRPP